MALSSAIYKPPKGLYVVEKACCYVSYSCCFLTNSCNNKIFLSLNVFSTIHLDGCCPGGGYLFLNRIGKSAIFVLNRVRV